MKDLQIVSFDYPYPPSYGGIIDVFFKIKALSEIGINIHLHCFVEQEPKHIDKEILDMVSSVFFYKKNRNPLFILAAKPFSVISRQSKALLKNIKKINAPILFEGLQTTYIIKELEHYVPKKYLRLHNNEASYYAGLSKSEDNPLKRMVYWLESKKYEYYQNSILKTFESIFCLSNKEYLEIEQSSNNGSFVGIFHGNDFVKPLDGKGEYFLFHGDLSISDNRKALDMAIDVFSQLPDYPLLIASDKATTKISTRIKDYKNITLVPIINHDNLNLLFSKAQGNILLSLQKSGTKVKLFNTLFNSRFVIINDNITDDKGLVALCSVINNQSELKNTIKEIANLDYNLFINKKHTLESVYSDLPQAQKMKKIIFKD